MRNKCCEIGGGEDSLGTNVGAELVSELICPLIASGLSTGLDSYSILGPVISVTEATYKGLEFSSNWAHLKIHISLSQYTEIGKTE